MTRELINIVKRKYSGCMGDYVVIVPINHPWVNGKKAGISKSINCVIVNDIPGAGKWHRRGNNQITETSSRIGQV